MSQSNNAANRFFIASEEQRAAPSLQEIGAPAPAGAETRVMVMGVGGCGNNTVSYLLEQELSDIELCVANTDAMTLDKVCAVAEERGIPLSRIDLSVPGGRRSGLGAGGRVESGSSAAQESEAEFERVLEGVDLLVITAGMGGGTGTGASPVVAQVARKLNVLTMGVVTMPHDFANRGCLKRAESGLARLREKVLSMVVISNQKLLERHGNQSIEGAFRDGMQALSGSIHMVHDTIYKHMVENVDFQDTARVLSYCGDAAYGSVEVADMKNMVDAVRDNLSWECQEISLDEHRAMGMLAILPPGTTYNQQAEIEKLLTERYLAQDVDAYPQVSTLDAEGAEKGGACKVGVMLTGLAREDLKREELPAPAEELSRAREAVAEKEAQGAARPKRYMPRGSQGDLLPESNWKHREAPSFTRFNAD